MEPTSQFGGSPELVFRPRLDLTDALARQVETVPDFLQRARLVIFQTEPQTDDFPLLPVEIAQGGGELVQVGLIIISIGHPILRDHLAQLARIVGVHRIVQRDVVNLQPITLSNLGNENARVSSDSA